MQNKEGKCDFFISPQSIWHTFRKVVCASLLYRECTENVDFRQMLQDISIIRAIFAKQMCAYACGGSEFIPNLNDREKTGGLA